MRKLNSLFIYLFAAMVAGTALVGCGGDDDEVTPGSGTPTTSTTFSFDSASSTSDGDTITENRNFTVSFSVMDPDSALKAVKITSNGNFVASSANNGSGTLIPNANGVIATGRGGNQVLSITATTPSVAADSMITYKVTLYGDTAATKALAEKSFKISVRNIPPTGYTYSNITIGSQSNTSVGSYFNTTDGLVYNSTDASSNVSKVDFLYNTRPDNDQPVLISWTARNASLGYTSGSANSSANETYFNGTASNRFAFDLINDTYNYSFIPVFRTVSTTLNTNVYVEIQADRGYYFITEDNKKGMVFVESISADKKTAVISVKVQR